MDGSDVERIIKIVNSRHDLVQTEFGKMHEKFDAKFGLHDKRLVKVEGKIALKEALCKKQKENEKKKRDYWLPVIRIVSAAGIVALVFMAAEKLVELWKLTP